jgi:hypothetical protein
MGGNDPSEPVAHALVERAQQLGRARLDGGALKQGRVDLVDLGEAVDAPADAVDHAAAFLAPHRRRLTLASRVTAPGSGSRRRAGGG